MVKKKVFKKVVRSRKLYNFKADLDNVWFFAFTVLILKLIIWGLATNKWYLRLFEVSINILVSILVVMFLDWVFTRTIYYEEV